ncbi:hypothetical protein OsI_25438 [Oryza sativa Indica Group]|uniref:Uncharacterized protein n=1 Tax=Oryza sativa subsp. indica TaxID=39946 RepID=A2YJN3_ORYSI|nr:hypothetical protein OsI_25438 [Oryza sativa Indica Group]
MAEGDGAEGPREGVDAEPAVSVREEARVEAATRVPGVVRRRFRRAAAALVMLRPWQRWRVFLGAPRAPTPRSMSTSTMSFATNVSPSRRRSLCSSRTYSMNASNILLIFFIRRWCSTDTPRASWRGSSSASRVSAPPRETSRRGSLNSAGSAFPRHRRVRRGRVWEGASQWRRRRWRDAGVSEHQRKLQDAAAMAKKQSTFKLLDDGGVARTRRRRRTATSARKKRWSGIRSRRRSSSGASGAATVPLHSPSLSLP